MGSVREHVDRDGLDQLERCSLHSARLAPGEAEIQKRNVERAEMSCSFPVYTLLGLGKCEPISLVTLLVRMVS